MKKLIRLVCMILVCSFVLAMPAQAVTTVETRESAYFSSYAMGLYKTSATSFDICFDVTSNVAIMDVLGVSEIILYRSANAQNWQKIKIYSMSAYANMVSYDTTSHLGQVSYNFASPGYYYTAYITFYARDSRGFGERYFYTEILQM